MASTNHLSAMLKQLGWGSGFKLPISNDENRKLEQMLEMKQYRLVGMSLEMQEVSLAVDNSTSFMKNLNLKMKHAKDVEAAKRSQMEKEKQFLSLAERDHAKTLQDLKNMEKRLKMTIERNKQLEESVVRRKDDLGELVDVINFDKKAITAYEEKFSKEDAYMKLIEDFADMDNEKLKKCREEYQQLGEKVANSKVHLNQTLSETEIMEGELDELAKRFRRAHAERNQSIENWKRTLDVLEDRDQEIMDISNDYKKASLEMKKKLGMLERQEAFYENVQVQSNCYRGELNKLERNMEILHKRTRETESQISDNSDAVSELVGFITLTNKEMRTLQTKLREMSRENDGWKDKMQAMKDELDSMKAKYDIVTMESMTSAEHMKQLQDFLDQEEKKVEAMTKELSKQIVWKSQREKQTHDIARDAMLAESEAKNLKSAIARNRKQRMETEDYLFKSKAMAYRLDLKEMGLQVKIQGLENPATLYSKEEYTENQMQIAKFKEIRQEQLDTQAQIKAQIGHCDHVNFACQKELQKEMEQNEEYEVKLYKLETEIRRIGKEDESFLETIKDMGVENSLLQVQLRKMVQSIKMYESKMFDLEQERITVQMAVKERKKEIEIFTSLMMNKKRALQDESQKLRHKCHEVSNDVQAKKRKYEMVMGQMWTGTDREAQEEKDKAKEGGGRSEAYYIIKLAQEREHYRQEGDKWDDRVKEAEKIVEGLQNTLALMIGTNEAFKDSLKPATDSTDEGRQLKELKQKELDAARSLKLMKDEREKCTQNLRQAQFQLDKLVSHKAGYEQQLMEKQYELQGIIIEINGQKEKIQRATQQANKLVRELSKVEALDAELLQNDLRLRVTKEKYEFAVLTLEKLLQTNPDLVGDTLEFLHAKGMEGLVMRITRKMISPSLTSTPHQSGRSTPYSSSRSIVTLEGRKPTKTSVRLGSSRSLVAKASSQSQSHSLLDRRSTQKSVVFETLTSTPSTKKMLENISKGLEAHRKSKAGTTAPRQTTVIGPAEAGGISFGELRKALQDAVAEQEKTITSELSQMDQESERKTEGDTTDQKVADDGLAKDSIASVGTVADSIVDVLVDNREKFAEGTHEDRSHTQT